jgi:hypothetical protein
MNDETMTRAEIHRETGCTSDCRRNGCPEECGEEVCKFCGGTGEVARMEYVWAGEPHMADVGSERCVCQLKENDSDMSGATPGDR